MRSMNSIEFDNPLFHEGINTTCRIGLRSFIVGQPIFLTKCREVLHTAEVVCVFQGAFFDLPEDLIAEEHDPECCDYSSLLAMMKSLYEDFEEDDYVTMIGFILDNQ